MFFCLYVTFIEFCPLVIGNLSVCAISKYLLCNCNAHDDFIVLNIYALLVVCNAYDIVCLTHLRNWLMIWGYTDKKIILNSNDGVDKIQTSSKTNALSWSSNIWKSRNVHSVNLCLDLFSEWYGFTLKTLESWYQWPTWILQMSELKQHLKTLLSTQFCFRSIHFVKINRDNVKCFREKLTIRTHTPKKTQKNQTNLKNTKTNKIYKNDINKRAGGICSSKNVS